MKRGALVMVGKTEATLVRNVLEPTSEVTGGLFKYSLGRHEAYWLGRKIWLVSANDAKAEAKIRGMTIGGIYGDEVTLWPESFFAMALNRLSVPGAKGFFTTNPDEPSHWLKTNWIDRANELDMRVFSWPITDNPYLPPDYIEAIKREYAYSPVLYQRFIEGRWVANQAGLFGPPTYYDELPNGGIDIIGFDAAYTERARADYTVALWLRYHNGVGYIYDMMRMQTTPERLIGALKTRGATELRWFRSGPERGLESLLRREGIKVYGLNASSSKLDRALPAIMAWQKGNIRVPKNASWLPVLIDELAAFDGSGAGHDDIVDALAAAWHVVATNAHETARLARMVY